jgi:hypothetical protein
VFFLFLLLGTLVAVFDLLFIFFVVPESLPERVRAEQKFSWDKIDPFAVSFIDILYKIEHVHN